MPIRSPRVTRKDRSRMMVRSPNALVAWRASITTLVLASSLPIVRLAAPCGPSIAARAERISFNLARRPWLRRRRPVTPRWSQCSSIFSFASSFWAARSSSAWTWSVHASNPPKPISARRIAPRSSHSVCLVSRVRKVRSWLMTTKAPVKRPSHSSSHSIAAMSRWLVGSSSSSTSGSCANARTIAARRRSPPDADAASRDRSMPSWSAIASASCGCGASGAAST